MLLVERTGNEQLAMRVPAVVSARPLLPAASWRTHSSQWTCPQQHLQPPAAT